MALALYNFRIKQTKELNELLRSIIELDKEH
jgi:hypothetical protein